MIEETNGVVTFTLPNDPQVYSLLFDFNAICDVETELKCNLMDGIMGGEFDARSTRALLYALLKPRHPQVLVGEAGALLTRDMFTVLKAVTRILKAPRGLTGAVEPEESEPETESAPVTA